MMNEENVIALFEMGKISEPSIEAAKVFCKNSKIGCYNCLVQTRFGWCCDVCLEDELLCLYSQGVHTINSCCGHGSNELKTIVVIGENSREKMETLGYELLEELENRVTVWRAKSKTISDEKDDFCSNGVTVQEWISVKDRLPSKEEYKAKAKDGTEYYVRLLIAYKTDIVEYEIGYYDGYKWMTEMPIRLIKDVVAWMPFPNMPQPPKGE